MVGKINPFYITHISCKARDKQLSLVKRETNYYLPSSLLGIVDPIGVSRISCKARAKLLIT